MNYGNWAVVAKIGNGGASAWSGSREFDSNHWDLKYKLRAEKENDPTGAYIRRWVPELQNVPDNHIHTPWFMTEEEQRTCGCTLGVDYPVSLVGSLDLTDYALDEAQTEVTEDSEKGLEISITKLKDQLHAKEEELAALRGGNA